MRINQTTGNSSVAPARARARARARAHAHAHAHAHAILCPLGLPQATACGVRTRLRGVLPGVLSALNLPAHVHYAIEPARGGSSLY